MQSRYEALWTATVGSFGSCKFRGTVHGSKAVAFVLAVDECQRHGPRGRRRGTKALETSPIAQNKLGGIIAPTKRTPAEIRAVLSAKKPKNARLQGAFGPQRRTGRSPSAVGNRPTAVTEPRSCHSIPQAVLRGQKKTSHSSMTAVAEISLHPPTPRRRWPMGTTAYGGKGSKGRAANGDRPIGAASCRREQYTKATCQRPPPV